MGWSSLQLQLGAAPVTSLGIISASGTKKELLELDWRSWMESGRKVGLCIHCWRFHRGSIMQLCEVMSIYSERNFSIFSRFS